MSTRSAFSVIGYSAPSLCKKVVRRRWTPPAAGEGDRLRNPFAFTPGQKDDVFLKKIIRLFFLVKLCVREFWIREQTFRTYSKYTLNRFQIRHFFSFTYFPGMHRIAITRLPITTRIRCAFECWNFEFSYVYIRTIRQYTHMASQEDTKIPTSLTSSNQSKH